MGRVWVCMVTKVLCYSQINTDTLYRHMVAEKQTQDLGGLGFAKNQRTWVQVRGRSVRMGRVGMCMLLCHSQIRYSHMVTQ